MRRRTLAAWFGSGVIVAATGCGVAAPATDAASADGAQDAAAPDAPPGFVVRSGPRLWLDGHPFRFTGFVVYNANSRNDCGYTMGEGPALGEAFDAMGRGLRVLRASFFQYFVTRQGRRDWAPFDHTIDVARAHGVRLVVVLDNQWYECSGFATREEGYHSEQWYREDYRTLAGVPRGYPATYREFVREVVARYRDEPTVLAWELMGEPEARTAVDGSCAPTAAATLHAWAQDVAGMVRAVDPVHLITLGTIGGGQCGTAGEHFRALAAIPNVDLCQYHDYQSSAPLPGDEFNGLAVRLRQCGALDKPLLVAEAGVVPRDVGGTLEARAAVFRDKFTAQYAAGVAAVMVFTWRDAAHGGSALDAYEVGPGDPTLALMQRWGERFASERFGR